MRFSPEISIVATTPPEGQSARQVDEALKDSVLAFVELRNRSIQCGDRNALDETYVGLDSRDYSLQREDHERVSYYDWYMNRIERGMGDEVVDIQVLPIYGFEDLPFKYNVNWTIWQPEFELRVKTATNETSWYIRRDVRKNGQFSVILPNMSDAPWKAPILETRGPTTNNDASLEFDADSFAKELASKVGLELCSWSVYLEGLVKIRAFALNVDPSEGIIQPCLLTDRENFDETECGKWSLADWRFFDFTGWEYDEDLCATVRDFTSHQPHDHKHSKFEDWAQPKQDFEVLLACVKAIKDSEFLRYLKRFELSDDFEFGVFHGHDEHYQCNFALEENQDLTVLIHEPE